MSHLGRQEKMALWAMLVTGLVALVATAWNETITSPDRLDPPAAKSLSGEEGRSLAELALAPEANANNIGVRLASEGKLDQAIESFRNVLQRDPDYLPGHKNQLAALIESRRWPEALAAAREAEAVHPLGKYLKAEVRRQKPEVGSATADPEPGGEAASGLKPAARVRVPEDPKVRAALYEERDFIANCARAYLENGFLDEAEALYVFHVQLCPNEVKGYNGLAERGPARGPGSGFGRLRSPPAASACIHVSGGYACFGVLAGNELARPLSDDRSPRQGQALRRWHPDDAVRLFAISLRTYGDQPDVVL
jgi:tetratricopeptide (TPR) repeat protein